METDDPIGVEILNYTDKFVERSIEEIGGDWDYMTDKQKKGYVLNCIERACDMYREEHDL